MKNLKKKGLFLSVELIVIIIIIALIIAIFVAGLAALIRSYRLFKISKDVSMYSEAVVNFKNSYNALPGDVTVASLSGPLNTANINTSMTNLAADTLILPATLRSFGNGIIGQHKSIISFQQLKAANLIQDNVISGNALPAAVNALTLPNIVSAQYLPISGFDSNLMWVLISEASVTDAATGVTPNSAINYPLVTTNGYGTFDANWSNTPRLVLIRHSEESTGTLPYDWTKKVGSISANLSAAYDLKFDDGLPYGVSSRIVGENAVNTGTTTTGGCNSLAGGAAVSPTTTNAAFLGASYMKNKSSSGTKGCILTIGISGIEE